MYPVRINLIPDTALAQCLTKRLYPALYHKTKSHYMECNQFLPLFCTVQCVFRSLRASFKSFSAPVSFLKYFSDANFNSLNVPTLGNPITDVFILSLLILKSLRAALSAVFLSFTDFIHKCRIYGFYYKNVGIICIIPINVICS